MTSTLPSLVKDFFILTFIRVVSSLFSTVCGCVYVCVGDFSWQRDEGKALQWIVKEGRKEDGCSSWENMEVYLPSCVLGGRNSKNAKMKLDCQVISGKQHWSNESKCRHKTMRIATLCIWELIYKHCVCTIKRLWKMYTTLPIQKLGFKQIWQDHVCSYEQ